MNVSVFSYVLSSCVAAALLAGCGASHLPIGAPGVMLQSRAITPSSLPYNRTFKYTGARQWFTVPAGVKRLTVVARGASGGSNFKLDLGGRGGRIYAVIPVTWGERLAVFVGGAGSQPSGGFNGGASGGAYPGAFSADGGGGASDVRQGGDRLANRILVAGGGGGEGSPLNPSNCDSELRPETKYPPDGNGGKGGGSTGGSGQTGCGGYGIGVGGAGGSQYSGGQGGAGGAGIGNPGSPGSRGRGGIGGAGCSGSLCGEPGGGGGGGYFGGGGGGAGSTTDINALGGGGGGGGSSYIEPSAQKFQSWQGWKNAVGNGLVVFSWQ